jgi:hypothetical protein
MGAAKVVLGASVAVGIRCLVCGTVVSNLAYGGVGVVPLLSVHGAVLALGLVFLVDGVGVEEAAWCVGVGTRLSGI